MINRVILMGRLVADPELKTTGTGVSVTSFRIAVDRSYVKSGEERKADFIDIVCWRQTAEFVTRYFSRGNLIAVEGQLQTRTFQAKDGSNRYVVEVVADNVSFTGERKETQQNYQSNAPTENPYIQAVVNPPATEAMTPPDASEFQEVPLDDDLPF